MYKYETHVHTSPVSVCARATVEETIKAYSELGYDAIILTNHFIDFRLDLTLQSEQLKKEYKKQLDFYFSDYEQALVLSKKYGVKVFLGVEISNGGSDCLIYGLNKEWYYNHDEILKMETSKKLDYFRENGAYVVQAHPFRESSWIDHFRLYFRNVDAIEVINATRSERENGMALKFAEHYGLKMLAGSDMHTANRSPMRLAGIETKEPINSIEDFIRLVKEDKYKIFHNVVE